MRKRSRISILAIPLLWLAGASGKGSHLAAQEELTLTVLFDNLWTDDRLQTGWGFAALLESPGHTVLFDTGADGSVLLENMRLLGKDPMAIEAVVLSHAHGDHTGGLPALLALGLRPRLYLLEVFPAQMRNQFTASAEIVLTVPGEEITPGIRSTGQVGAEIPEQALVIDGEKGPILLTGCAHPGILEMIRRGAEVAGEPIHEVLGGFHLMNSDGATLRGIVEGFQELGVEVAGPTHCSGLMAMTVFQDAYGENFQRMGVGRVLTFPR
jgi:7,8-dihydropterin-6-yl-methyl-4-(beta-D-ribofuranosyl)aminobenzene 5'-phosphate synthase